MSSILEIFGNLLLDLEEKGLNPKMQIHLDKDTFYRVSSEAGKKMGNTDSHEFSSKELSEINFNCGHGYLTIIKDENST